MILLCTEPRRELLVVSVMVIWCFLYRRIFVYIFCLINIRALVSYGEIQWSAINNNRVLKDKLCQKI